MKQIIVLATLIAAFSTAPLSGHAATALFPKDSIGIEKNGSKSFILHKVDPKETLFSISRKYGVHVNVIKETNPETKSGLSIGQVIKIPYEAPVKTTGKGMGKTHLVEPKETLYSISKKYKVSIEDIKKANPDIADGIKPGDVILLSGQKGGKKEKEVAKQSAETQAAPIAPVVKPAEKEQEKPIEVKETKRSDADGNENQQVNDGKEKTSAAINTVTAPVASSSYKKINESGFANLMENNSADLKYLALHKSAPVGTIIQVRNEDNNQKIFVRVTGKLSAVPSDKVILKISPKAFERLGAKGDKIPVSISYIP